MSVPAAAGPALPQQIISVSAGYRDVVRGVPGLRAHTLEIPRTAATDDTVNKDVDAQRNRLTAAEAMESAVRSADKGDLVSARRVLENAVTKIANSASAGDTFCVRLVADLRACLPTLRHNSAYQSAGCSYLSSCSSGYAHQRATGSAYLGMSDYVTPARMAVYSNITGHS